MKTWQKVMFVSVLAVFICLSVMLTFVSIARKTFEFKHETSVGSVEGLDGYVFHGFSGNASVKDVHIDFVRDEKGKNPDESKPVVGVSDFTIVSDEYVEFIYIGKSVRYIDEKAFYYCKKLKAVFVDEENEYFTSVDGCLYSKDMTRLYLHPIMNGDWLIEQGKSHTGDSFSVPDGVRRINSCAFYKNDKLVNLTLPDTVEEIGDMAFFGCSSMKTVRLPEGLKSIGSDAFSYCGSMGPVFYIPKTVEKIGHHAFFSSNSVTEMYLGAENEDAFESGESWLPKSVKKGLINKNAVVSYSKTYADAAARADELSREEEA